MITPFIQENGQLMSTDQINHKRKFAEGKKTLSSEQNDIWTPVGPLTTHWKSEDNADMDACPWQANIYCLEIAPSDPGILYIVTETGSFFRSADKGKNWELRGGSYLLNSKALAIHPNDASTLLLGTNNVVRKSTDGGLSWTNIYTNNDLWCNRIIIHPTKPDNILLCSNK